MWNGRKAILNIEISISNAIKNNSPKIPSNHVIAGISGEYTLFFQESSLLSALYFEVLWKKDLLFMKPSIRETTIKNGNPIIRTKNGKKDVLISLIFPLTVEVYLSNTSHANHGAIKILISAKDW